MDKFLEMGNWPRLKHEETENLSGSLTSTETEAVTDNFPTKQSPGAEHFPGKPWGAVSLHLCQYSWFSIKEIPILIGKHVLKVKSYNLCLGQWQTELGPSRVHGTLNCPKNSITAIFPPPFIFLWEKNVVSRRFSSAKTVGGRNQRLEPCLMPQPISRTAELVIFFPKKENLVRLAGDRWCQCPHFWILAASYSTLYLTVCL